MKTGTRIVLLLSLVLSLIALPGITQAGGGATYTDPQGRFTVDMPTGWTDHSTDQYGLFENADGAQVYLVAVEGSEVQAGIQAALALATPDITSQPVQSNEIPLPNGTWTQNVYTSGAALDAVLGQVDSGTVYVLIMRIPNVAQFQGQLQIDLNTILSNFTIGQTIDLAGMVPPALTSEQLAAIDQYIAAEFEKSGIPGAAVAIVQDGKVIYARGFGVREVGSKDPVDDQTLFLIGSTTKSMTTLMTATLVDDGVLDWNTPVLDILPSFALSDPTAAAKIRVRDLFNMSSGVKRNDATLLVENPTPEEMIASLAKIQMVAQPGEQYNYSNQMVASGGYIVALAAGAKYGVNVYDTYKDLLQTRVFDRIGMTASTINFDQAVASSDHALPHTDDILNGGEIAVPIGFERFTIASSPAGAVWSNAQDMGKYMITELQRGVAPDGKRVVSEANLLATQTPEIAMSDSTSYGMGWMIEDYYGQKMIEHNGGTSGFTCDLSFLPDAGLGVVVLMNRTEGETFSGAVRGYVYETAFGMTHRYQPDYTTIIDLLRQQLRLSAPDAASVQDYLGRYEYNLTVAIDDQGEFTLATIYGAAPLLSMGKKGSFITGGGIPGLSVQFKADAQGTMTITLTDSALTTLTDPTDTLTLKRISE